jgi:hypothetical protein
MPHNGKLVRRQYFDIKCRVRGNQHSKNISKHLTCGNAANTYTCGHTVVSFYVQRSLPHVKNRPRRCKFGFQSSMTCESWLCAEANVCDCERACMFVLWWCATFVAEARCERDRPPAMATYTSVMYACSMFLPVYRVWPTTGVSNMG